MDEKIKSYRQAIFKLDHAERKRGEVLPSAYIAALCTYCTKHCIVPATAHSCVVNLPLGLYRCMHVTWFT